MEGFANEEELRMFLLESPDLFPVDELGQPGMPLLCIGREVYVSSGSEDLLLIDRNGLLTVVETKLGRNPQARREVVGQILEYAAKMAEWEPKDVERQAQEFYKSEYAPPDYRNLSLIDAMKKFLGDQDFAYEEFLEDVAENIEAGRFRLVIAVDEPPDSLKRTVEFVNRFSERFEILLFQLRRFRDESQDIFIPALFGQVPPIVKPRKPRPVPWDEERFLEDLRANADHETVEYTKRVYSQFKEWNPEELPTDKDLWGTGATYGTYNLVLQLPTGRLSVAQITSDGALVINFGNMFKRNIPKHAIGRLQSALNAVDGVQLPPELENKYPSLPRTVLKDSARRDAILAALHAFIQEASTHD